MFSWSLPGRGLDTSSFLSYNMCSFVAITKKFFVWSQKHSTYSENRDDQSMLQVVAYRKLKTMESWKTVTPKSGRSRLRQVIFLPRGSNWLWLEKPLVFCLGGGTWRFNWSCIIVAKRFNRKKCFFVNCCRIHSRCFLPTLLWLVDYNWLYYVNNEEKTLDSIENISIYCVTWDQALFSFRFENYGTRQIERTRTAKIGPDLRLFIVKQVNNFVLFVFWQTPKSEEKKKKKKKKKEKKEEDSD